MGWSKALHITPICFEWRFPNNKNQVIKIAEREEKRLIKSNLLEAFNNEFDKMIRLGALVELEDTELKIKLDRSIGAGK